MTYWPFNDSFYILVTVRSIRRELAINEKQGPTTTEMTTKSVSWSREWCYRWLWRCDIQTFQWQKSILVTARSIRREQAINEKQGPTTTEMTTKSVSWNHEWCYKWLWCCDTMTFQWINFHPPHRQIHTERTSHQREAGTNYDRNGNQISDLESRLMLPMPSR